MRLPRRSAAAFTLVELLVVIGIIALLVSILLPTLSNVRQQAQQIKCASNLRQLAIGWLVYAASNNGVSVPGRMANYPAPATNVYGVGNGDQWRPRWFVTLGAQSGLHAYDVPSPLKADDNIKLVDNPVFLCPTEPERVNNRNFTYGYNFQFLGNSRLTLDKSRFINFPVKVNRIRPSDTVLAADAQGTAAGKALADRTPCRLDGGNTATAVGNHAWSLDPPRIIGDALSEYCNDEDRNAVSRSAPDPRHRGKATVAFCDGHVELMSLQDLGYVVNPNGSVALNGPGTTNRLFGGDATDRDPPPIN